MTILKDNFPPYQMDDLEEPTKRYSMFFGNGQGWEHCQIDHFVAPLYHKVYLDPTVAKEYIKSLITSPLIEQIHNTEITLRVFLCSTRSYLDYVMKSSMSDDMKNVNRDDRPPLRAQNIPQNVTRRHADAHQGKL